MPAPYFPDTRIPAIHHSLRQHIKQPDQPKEKVVVKDGNEYHFRLRYQGKEEKPGGSSFHLHRKDAPAIVFANGDQHWYSRGKLDRKGAPAIVCVNGEKHWYRKGLLHNLEGAAIEYTDGRMNVWAIDGNVVSRDICGLGGFEEDESA